MNDNESHFFSWGYYGGLAVMVAYWAFTEYVEDMEFYHYFFIFVMAFIINIIFRIIAKLAD